METPVHFTYTRVTPADDLQQGDILQPTESLRRMLTDVHPHFLDQKYCAFLVLTQTCDLVRRDGRECRSRYINLAVVRPVEDILEQLLDKVCKRISFGSEILPGAYLSETKNKAHELLERILNQNEQGLGIFYVHNDAAVGIADPSAALLQVSIAVRAAEHYVPLVEARSGRLTAEFQGRLGWLAGNLYSRVATRDMDRTKIKQLIRRFLLGARTPGGAPVWITRAQNEEAHKAKLDARHLKAPEILEAIRQLRPKRPRDIAIERAVVAIQKVGCDLEPGQVEQITATLRNDEHFKKACRE